VKNVAIPATQIGKALKSGISFDGSSIEGFARIQESDMVLQPDLSTFSILPWRTKDGSNEARLICDVHLPSGQPFEGDPRRVLRRQLEKAQEIGNIGSWELDIQKNILIWTDENYKIFGIPPGTDMNYERFLECVHPNDRDYVNEQWNKGIETRSYDIEHRLLIDNKIKWVREKAKFDFDDKGQPIKAIGFTQDITKRKQAEDQLREKMTELERFNKVMVGRETRMIELKQEINELCEKLGISKKYGKK